MKRKMKKVLCMVLAFSLSMLTIIDGANSASGKAKITKKRLTLTVGQKKKISIKGKKKKAKYSFSSSSAKKASVSKKGFVTAKKAGTAKITVKEKLKGKKKRIGTVTVTIKDKKKRTQIPAVTETPSEALATTKPTITPTVTPTATPSVTPKPTAKPSPKVTPTPFVENPEMIVPAGAFDKNGVTERTEVFKYNSTAVSEGETVQREALVAFPVNYKSTKTYPVVYGLHGYGWGIYNLAKDGATNVGWNGYSNDTMDQVIMVFPNICANKSGVGQGYDQATYDAYDNCVNDIVNCLMPAIEETYPVKKGRKNTAVWGFSMGGREALNLGFKHPELFGYIGAFCPAPGVLPYTAEKGIFTEDTFKLPDEYNNDTLVMIVKGVNDSTVGDNPLLYHNALTKNGTNHIYYETMGGDERNRGGGGHQNVVYLHGLYNLMVRAFPCN